MGTQIQKLDVELRLKSEEAQRVLHDSNAKRKELTRISSSRSAIQQCQAEFENAQRTHDEFMGSYANKSAQYKKQIKVHLWCYSSRRTIQIIDPISCWYLGCERPDPRLAGSYFRRRHAAAGPEHASQRGESQHVYLLSSHTLILIVFIIAVTRLLLWTATSGS